VRDAGQRPAQVRGVEHTGPERKDATRIWGRVLLDSGPLGGGVPRHAFLP